MQENSYVAVVVLQVGLCLYSYYLVTKGQALSLPNNRYIFTVANLRHIKFLNGGAKRNERGAEGTKSE